MFSLTKGIFSVLKHLQPDGVQATMEGSLFLNELNGRSVLRGLSCLQDLSNKEPPNVYWHPGRIYVAWVLNHVEHIFCVFFNT